VELLVAPLANLQDQQRLRKHADQVRIMRTAGDHPIGCDVFSWGLTKVTTSSNILTRSCTSLPEMMSQSELGGVRGPLRLRLLSSRELLILPKPS
jgi:hypothetical protein